MKCTNSAGRELDVDPVVEMEYNYNSYDECEGDIEEPIDKCLKCKDINDCWVVRDLMEKYLKLKDNYNELCSSNR